jgi:carboxylesterase type B
VVNLKNPKSGKIRGKTYTFEDGREASAFLGIPYAKPPIGDLRFKVYSILAKKASFLASKTN